MMTWEEAKRHGEVLLEVLENGGYGDCSVAEYHRRSIEAIEMVINMTEDDRR